MSTWLRRTGQQLSPGARKVLRPVARPLMRLDRKVLRSRRRRQTEVYLLSYPKCGRTWLRMLVGRVIQTHFDLSAPDPTDLYELTRRLREVPTIGVNHDDRPQWKPAAQIETDKRRYAGNDVIFLVRDPRDVVVSEYFQATRRRVRFEGSLEDFMHTEVGGIDAILTFYNVWARAIEVPRSFLLVRYEDLHADPHGELRRVLDFLGLGEVAEASIDESVAFASFDNMRRLEAQGTFTADDRLRPGDPHDEESFKTRRGVVGGFRDYLASEQAEALTDRVRRQLDPVFGYPVEDF